MNKTNDGSADAPKLSIWINLENLADLRADSIFPATLLADAAARDARLAADGFAGVQLTDDAPPAPGSTLPYCGLGRVFAPAEAEPVVARSAARGDACLTLHVGRGWESDAEADRLIEAVLAASARHRHPVFVETHRATLTQDLWRTARLLERWPELRLNGDFSHYYCGQEMIYGEWTDRLASLEPIFARVGFMHGRVASSGNIQVPVGAGADGEPLNKHGEADYLAHFRDIWTHAMAGFLRGAGPGDVLIFAPELLSPIYGYARVFPDASGRLVEETDRYAEALALARLARECWEAARGL